MFDTIRELAAEKLSASAESAVVRRRRRRCATSAWLASRRWTRKPSGHSATTSSSPSATTCGLPSRGRSRPARSSSASSSSSRSRTTGLQTPPRRGLEWAAALLADRGDGRAPCRACGFEYRAAWNATGQVDASGGAGTSDGSPAGRRRARHRDSPPRYSNTAIRRGDVARVRTRRGGSQPTRARGDSRGTGPGGVVARLGRPPGGRPRSSTSTPR